jgi:hypothetical protein
VVTCGFWRATVSAHRRARGRWFIKWWAELEPEEDQPVDSAWSPIKNSMEEVLRTLVPELSVAGAIAFQAPLSEQSADAARAVATMPNTNCPAFEGWGLWFQRSALLAWHRYVGLDVIRQALADTFRPILLSYLDVRLQLDQKLSADRSEAS